MGMNTPMWWQPGFGSQILRHVIAHAELASKHFPGWPLSPISRSTMLIYWWEAARVVLNGTTSATGRRAIVAAIRYSFSVRTGSSARVDRADHLVLSADSHFGAQSSV
jgi:hypothetical protein